MRDRATARHGSAPVVSVVLGILGILAGTVRLRHSRAGPDHVFLTASLGRGDLTCAWLILSQASALCWMLCAAASTASAWPSPFTLRQILAMRPSRPIRIVLLMMPRNLRPYKVFSPQAP